MAGSQLLNEISKLVGLQTAILLTRRYGGKTLTIPSIYNLTETHALTLTIGLAPAQALAKEYGGIDINLPTEVNALLEVRNDQIVRRFIGDGETGESIRSLSIDFGMDRRYIQKLIDRAGYRDLRLSRSVTEL